MTRKRKSPETPQEQIDRMTARLIKQLPPNSVPEFKELLMDVRREGYEEGVGDEREGGGW